MQVCCDSTSFMITRYASKQHPIRDATHRHIYSKYQPAPISLTTYRDAQLLTLMQRKSIRPILICCHIDNTIYCVHTFHIIWFGYYPRNHGKIRPYLHRMSICITQKFKECASVQLFGSQPVHPGMHQY